MAAALRARHDRIGASIETILKSDPPGGGDLHEPASGTRVADLDQPCRPDFERIDALGLTAQRDRTTGSIEAPYKRPIHSVKQRYLVTRAVNPIWRNSGTPPQFMPSPDFRQRCDHPFA